jgi:hypothetical protein
MPKKPSKASKHANYISVRQPYAWAIIAGHKDVENRMWPTNIRGRIYIHAGQSREDLSFGMDKLKQKGVQRLPAENDLVFGALIGSVEVVDCVESHRSKWYAEGTFGFVLARPKKLRQPIPMKANAKMQRVPDRVVKKLPAA